MDVQGLVDLRYGAGEEVPVCLRCSLPVSPLDYYCAKCLAPQGRTTSLPFVDIWATADFQIRLVDEMTQGRCWIGVVLFLILGFQPGLLALLIPVYLFFRILRSIGAGSPG